MKAACLGGEPAHARLVAEDRTAAPGRGRIDGEHRHLLAAGNQVQPKLIDERGFAGAGNAADADPDGVAGARQQPLEQRLRADCVLGLGALDEGDGTGERDPVAGLDGLDRLVHGLPVAFGAHGERG